MRATSLIFAAALLAPGTAPAAAQTYSATQLQALATQDAQQYGIPTNLFLAQIQGESGFNPNPGTSSAGAVGIAQFLPSTAASLGIDPNDPVQALQGAARYDAQLYQQTGSYSAALTSYTGGLTASRPGNSSYAAAFQDAQAADAAGLNPTTLAANPSAQDGMSFQVVGPSAAGTSGSGAADFSGGDGNSTTPAGSIGSSSGGALTTAPGQLDNFFIWLNTQLITATQANVQGLITQIQTQVAASLLAIMTLAVIIWALRAARTAYSEEALIRWMATAILVTVAISTDSGFYATYIATPIANAPTLVAQLISPGATSPSAEFAGVWSNAYALKQHIDSETSGWFNYLAVSFLLDFALLVLAIGLVMMDLPFLIGQVFLEILAIVGPVIFPFALFEPLKGIFWGWAKHIITILLTLLGINIVLNMYGPVLTAAINAAVANGNPEADSHSFCGLALSLFIVGATTLYLSAMFRDIVGQGVELRLAQASRWLSWTPVAEAAGAAAVGGTAAAGAAALGAPAWVAFTRYAPVGASLSRAI